MREPEAAGWIIYFHARDTRNSPGGDRKRDVGSCHGSHCELPMADARGSVELFLPLEMEGASAETFAASDEFATAGRVKQNVAPAPD